MSDVQLVDLSVRRGEDMVVRSLNCAIPSGAWTMIVGPNGAGKSSLLGAIAGVHSHTGALLIDGRDVSSIPGRERARLISVVPQRPELPAGMDVVDYVMLGRTAHRSLLGRPSSKDKAVVAETLLRLDLEFLSLRPVNSLSGGEVQRASIARALVQEARVLLLDEPTSALDIRHQQQALELIDGLRREDGLTVISACHDLTLAAQFADEIALLACGELMSIGTPAEVLTVASVQAAYGAEVAIISDPVHGLAVIPVRGRARTESV
jgi:iron complex transport system ATP-binding protein